MRRQADTLASSQAIAMGGSDDRLRSEHLRTTGGYTVFYFSDVRHYLDRLSRTLMEQYEGRHEADGGFQRLHGEIVHAIARVALPYDDKRRLGITTSRR